MTFSRYPHHSDDRSSAVPPEPSPGDTACAVLSSLRRQPGDAVYVETCFRDWAQPASGESLDEAARAAGQALARLSPVWLEGLTGHGGSLARSEILVMTALAARQRRMDRVHRQALCLLAADGYADLLGAPLDGFADMLSLHGRPVPATPSGAAAPSPVRHAGDGTADMEQSGHLDRLSRGERLVIEGMRHVVHCWRRQVSSHPTLDRAMRAHGLVDFAGPLDALITIMAASATRPIDVRCRRCRSCSADEARLTQVIAARQRGAGDAALAFLADMITPAGRRMALHPLHGLATAMVRGQAILPRRPLPPDLPPGAGIEEVADAARAPRSLH